MSLDPIMVRHKRLLTDISDSMVCDSEEYSNFVEHMKGYVPRGLLHSRKNLLGKFDALASKGHLKPGKYDVLKKIAMDSGNIDIVGMIEATEKDNYLELVKQGGLELDQPAIRHRLLLTNISDMFDTASQEYLNFVEHMKGYVPRGLLASRKSLLGQFDALASRGHLGPGNYDVLKKISRNSGNMDIIDLIEQAETDLQMLKFKEKEKKTFVSPIDDFGGIKNDLSNAILSNAIQVAGKKATEAGSSKTIEDIESIVKQTQSVLKDYQDDKSDDVGNHPEVNELFIELRKQKYLSAEKAPLPDNDDSGIGSFSETSSRGTKRTASVCSSEDTGADMSGNREKRRKHDISPLPELVDQQHLNSMWAQSRKIGKDKTKVFYICNNICSYIKSKYSGNVLHVWPAYDSANLDDVVFVLITKDGTEYGLEYSAVIRPVNTFSKEASVVMESEEISECKLSFEDSEKIKHVINNRAEELMKNHKNLSAISGNGIRSKGFSHGEHELIRETCIVLYVHTKGKIPLDETEFPKLLDGIPVDVREGEFQNCALATEYQETARMGCQIKSGKSGTLGGFVDHPEYGLCAITCAHVVLNDTEIHDLQRDGSNTWRNNEKLVFQPDDTNIQSHYFGQVKEARYNSGGSGKSGVDLAILQIERRPPDSGNFPDVNNAPTDMVFESGKSCSSLNENNNRVMKFGRTTNKTEGFVQFSNAAVKLIDHVHRYTIPWGGDFSYRLFNQFEIRALTGSFVKKGDSGSLVFKKDVTGELLCVGMVVGMLEPSGNGIVVPISAVLSELGVKEFKDFRWKRLDRIEKLVKSIDKRLTDIARNQRK
ncbi:uncharacterized protein LOC123545053 [Mercenaria mercenaria]|uniref:uncharacterized protein LOC123545053 n=1 Tax=Mercenaria mercenaria TaxID=6596 RepID=UPI00234F90E5|nr:uncharacterized protein LOC123545053 [Mercenaria mercenaria]